MSSEIPHSSSSIPNDPNSIINDPTSVSTDDSSTVHNEASDAVAPPPPLSPSPPPVHPWMNVDSPTRMTGATFALAAEGPNYPASHFFLHRYQPTSDARPVTRTGPRQDEMWVVLDSRHYWQANGASLRDLISQPSFAARDRSSTVLGFLPPFADLRPFLPDLDNSDPTLDANRLIPALDDSYRGLSRYLRAIHSILPDEHINRFFPTPSNRNADDQWSSWVRAARNPNSTRAQLIPLRLQAIRVFCWLYAWCRSARAIASRNCPTYEQAMQNLALASSYADPCPPTPGTPLLRAIFDRFPSPFTSTSACECIGTVFKRGSTPATVQIYLSTEVACYDLVQANG